MGAITVGIEIWEMGIIPFLPNNADTWIDLVKSSLKEVDNLQLMFYSTLLATHRTCPVPILLWDTGGIIMEHRIAMKKLQFYHHIRHRDPESLASLNAELQEECGFPGLLQECKKLLQSYRISDDARILSKSCWKRKVKSSVLKKNYDDILEMSKTYKRLTMRILCMKKLA